MATTNSLTALILGLVRFFLGFLFLVSVVALIYAGVLMVTALGDEGKVKKGKTIITWVIGGIVVIFLAYAIVNTVLGAIS